MRRAGTQDRWLVHALRHLTPGSGAWRLAHKLREWRRSMPHLHPRQTWMAEQLGVSERTVRRWIVELETVAGCVVVTRHRPHHGPDGRWRRRTNAYRPCFRRRQNGQNGGKALVAPTGHECPHDVPYGRTCTAGGSSPPPPPPTVHDNVERPRDEPGNDGYVGTYWPDHFAPLTWYRCIVKGCQTRVDPWDHNTRCPTHRPDPDTIPARVTPSSYAEARAAARARPGARDVPDPPRRPADDPRPAR